MPPAIQDKQTNYAIHYPSIVRISHFTCDDRSENDPCLICNWVLLTTSPYFFRDSKKLLRLSFSAYDNSLGRIDTMRIL